jgi:glyceraldehyde 3-phosphate dehydrogenase
MAVKVAINGLGRIGRCAARIIASRNDVELVAVNASGSEEMIQYNLKYDTVHGPKFDVKVEGGYIYIGKDKAKILSERDPAKIDFASCGFDVEGREQEEGIRFGRGEYPKVTGKFNT